MKKLVLSLSLLGAAGLVGLTGCETTPKTSADRQALKSESKAAMTRMESNDPSLKDLLNRSYGYAIFPSVGKGGLIVGGSWGRGEVYEQGRLIGYAELEQATVGLQAGGQEFSELVVFQTQDALQRFTRNEVSFTANASAVALKAGAAGAAEFQNGIAVFTIAKSGLMLEASIGGQRFVYQPLGTVPATRPANER